MKTLTPYFAAKNDLNKILGIVISQKTISKDVVLLNLQRFDRSERTKILKRVFLEKYQIILMEVEEPDCSPAGERCPADYTIDYGEFSGNQNPYHRH